MNVQKSFRGLARVIWNKICNSFRVAMLIVLIIAAFATFNQRSVSAQDAKPKDWILAEDVVPGNSKLFLSIPNIIDIKERFKGTALYDIWVEPEVQDFLQPLLKVINDGIKLGLKEEIKKWTGVEFDEVKSVFTKQIALAVIDFDSFAPVPLVDFGRTNRQVFNGVFFADISDMQKFQRILSNLETELTKPDKNGKAKVDAHGEYEFEGVKIKTMTSHGITHCYTFLKNTFVYATSKNAREVMESIISNYKGKARNSLAKNPSFIDVKSRVAPNGGDFLLYVKLSDIISKNPPASKQILEAVGISGIDALGVGASIQGRGIHDRFYASLSGAPKGYMAFVSPKPFDTKLLDIVPQGITTFGASRFNLSSFWEEVNAMARQYDPNSYAQFQKTVANFEVEAGVNLHKFFASLGKEAILTYIPTPAGAMSFGLTDYVLIFTLKNRTEAQQGLDNLAKYAVTKLSKTFAKQFGRGAPQNPTQWRENKYKNYTIKYVVLQGIPFLITPAYVTTEKYLLIGLSPQSLTATIDRIEAGGPSVMSNKDFKEVTSHLSQGYGAILYMDLKKEFPRFYALARMAIPMLQSQLKGIDFTRFPQAETINQHLFGYATILKTFRNEAGVPNGVLLESYSPIGNVGLIGSFSMIMGAPALMRAREAAKNASCKNNLKQIGIALINYQQDNKKLPSKLEDLSPKYLASKNVFICPSDANPNQISNELATSYVYIPNPPMDAISKVIVVYESQSRHNYGRNVLFLDGHVQWMSEGRFRRVLEEQEEKGGKAAVEKQE